MVKNAELPTLSQESGKPTEMFLGCKAEIEVPKIKVPARGRVMPPFLLRL
jgi:hypothetical protein